MIYGYNVEKQRTKQLSLYPPQRHQDRRPSTTAQQPTCTDIYLLLHFHSPFSLDSATHTSLFVRSTSAHHCCSTALFTNRTCQCPPRAPTRTIHVFFLSLSIHKVHIHTEYHCVCPLVETGTRQRVDPSPPYQRGGAYSPGGEGLGESQFRRLEKKLSTLPTLCLSPALCDIPIHPSRAHSYSTPHTIESR